MINNTKECITALEKSFALLNRFKVSGVEACKTISDIGENISDVWSYLTKTVKPTEETKAETNESMVKEE